MMDINVFLLCYNESVLLPHTIKHYRKYLPSCKITVYDNESTDNSVEIAKSLGCVVASWSSNNMIDDFRYRDMKNYCWSYINDGWIIMADMDEFLCVTESDLLEEMNNGTTILKVEGRDMIGESNTLDLSDIDLQDIKKYVDNKWENKNLCFYRGKITEMNYAIGAHECNPRGIVKYSTKTYINKHMSSLGLKFIIDKMHKRYERSAVMRSRGLAIHYINNSEEIEKIYMNSLQTCRFFE